MSFARVRHDLDENRLGFRAEIVRRPQPGRQLPLETLRARANVEAGLDSAHQHSPALQRVQLTDGVTSWSFYFFGSEAASLSGCSSSIRCRHATSISAGTLCAARPGPCCRCHPRAVLASKG